MRLGNFTAAAPPQFTEVAYDADLDEAAFTWTSAPGERFIIDYSEDLVNWIELEDGWQASMVGETTSYLDVNAGLFDRKYYRVERSAP